MIQTVLGFLERRGTILQRDNAVSLARIVGMVFIVACHIGNHYHNAIVSQLFNVGVPLFFVISGGLYANRKLEKPKEWIINRIVRLYMPLMAWFLYSLINFLFHESGHLSGESIGALVLIFFNLQGLQHLFPAFRSVDGPWFFTVIMLCYCLLIPYKKIENRYKKINSWCFLIIMFVVASLISISGIVDLSGIFCFFGGYILTKLGYNDREKKHSVIVAGILVIGSCGIRVMGKELFDGLWIYDDVLVLLSHFILSFGILKGIRWLRSINTLQFDCVMSSPMMKWLDMISVYVYCFHGIFIAGNLSVFNLNLHFIPSIVTVYMASFVLATIAYIIFETLGREIRNKIEK